MNAKPFLFDLTFDQLQDTLAGWKQPAYRAKQVWEWLYRNAADSIDAMSNLPAALRERLDAEFTFSHLTPRIDLTSSDGSTRKVLFDLPARSERDAAAQIEAVLMGDDTRRTTCISTQAGCAMGCPFCATGQGGLQRNLSAGEIVEQVLFYERTLHAQRQPDQTHGLTNIVFMGMGEPFANYRATIHALERLTDPTGCNFAARRITVSTVGLIPGITKFARDGGQVNLAISLHAATDELRDQLAPINKTYPLRDLIEAAQAYIEATNRRLSFEWALIDGVNDSVDQARALAVLVREIPKNMLHVNLIPLNATRDYKGGASRRERRAAFRAELERNGITNTMRVRRGIDINAGCGQLRQAIATA